MRNWVGKRRVELPKSKGTQNWTFRNCMAVLETALQFWKLHCSFYLITLSLVFNLTNLKSRGYLDEALGGQKKSRTTQEGYPDEELGGQEKSITTQEQGNSKLQNWIKLFILVNKGQRNWSLADGGRPARGGGGGDSWPAAGGRRWWPAVTVGGGGMWPAVVVVDSSGG
ncbi:unnamed protein product [Prunus armeniaca]